MAIPMLGGLQQVPRSMLVPRLMVCSEPAILATQLPPTFLSSLEKLGDLPKFQNRAVLKF